MTREEFKKLVEDCKVLVFKNGTWEQIYAVHTYGLDVMTESASTDDVRDTALAALADTLEAVYLDTLKWMSQTERELIEDRIAIAVWMKLCEDLKGARCL